MVKGVSDIVEIIKLNNPRILNATGIGSLGAWRKGWAIRYPCEVYSAVAGCKSKPDNVLGIVARGTVQHIECAILVKKLQGYKLLGFPQSFLVFGDRIGLFSYFFKIIKANIFIGLIFILMC